MTDSALSGTWDIDPTHTRIGFAARHAMVTKVRGAFNEVSGTLVLDTENPSASSATLTVQMTSIDTRTPQRDEHLRSADFFDVGTYPEMTFVARRIEEVDEGSWIVDGALTIRDVTRDLAVPLRLVGIENDPFGAVRAGLEGSRRIDRRDWGISWNTPLDSGGLLVSESIQLEFDLSLVKRA